MGEQRDERGGEGVEEIACPFLKEDDFRESLDILRTSGGELSRIGAGVTAEGSCFWKPASSDFERIRRIGGLDAVFAGVSSSSRPLVRTGSGD